jgi:ssDNA-binding Zn-finger/Zn-ribbon topoisomerase 1
MKNCPNCNATMDEVNKSALDAQNRMQHPEEGSPVTGVFRVRSQCPKCQHVEEGFPLPTL